MRIGAKLPTTGRQPIEVGIPTMARALEDAGADSLWVSDHIVQPREIRAKYPFAADGRASWPTDAPYLDALVALALAAAVTERVRLGTAVLVLPLRNPVELAKQAASIDVASGGRLELGVGAGWLEEEFAALGVPFAGRGARLAEWMRIVRSCWTGEPDASSSARYELPAGILVYPTPAHPIPLLVGGHSAAALRRAGRIGDGWLAQQDVGELDAAELSRAAEQIAAAAPDGDLPRIVLRVAGSLGQAAEVAERLPALVQAGVDEIIVDVPPDTELARRELDVLRAAVTS